MDLLKLPYEQPFSAEWKIKKADLESFEESSTNRFWSPYYFASKYTGTRYYFEILPYHVTKESETQTRLYLYVEMEENIKEIKAEYQIAIESANFCKNDDSIYKKDSGGKGTMLCKSEEFFDSANNYFVNDEIIITINGTLNLDRPLIPKPSYPFSFEWKITAAELEFHGEPKIQIKSQVFETDNITYNFEVRLTDSDDGKVFFGLHCEFEDDIEVLVIMLYSCNSTAHKEIFYQIYKNSDRYKNTICSTDDLFDVTKGYIVDGEVTIKIKGIFFIKKKDPKFSLPINGFNGETLLLEKNFKIIVGEHGISVNKELLSSVSSVFAGMLQSGMKEAIEGKMEITDFPFKTVDAAIYLMYGISPTFTLDDMLPLLVFSDKYYIKTIKELVENHLISVLSPFNVCQLIHFSTLFNALKLYEKSAEFFVQSFKDSIPVNDLDLIDKDMYYKIFSSAFQSLSS